ncbi:MAG: hypothetical protein VYE64_07495 [Planctomycetota bacterium]|nr:hypothetical protein [Planctomycetota bacterium]
MIVSRIWIAMLLVSTCMLAGCTSPEREMLVGQWRIEAAGKILNRIGQSASITPESSPEEVEQNQMLLVFHANGKLETITQMGAIDRKKTGTWELLEFREAAQTSFIRCNLNGQTTEHEVDWLTNGNLKMVPPNLAGTRIKLEFCRVD